MSTFMCRGGGGGGGLCNKSKCSSTSSSSSSSLDNIHQNATSSSSNNNQNDSPNVVSNNSSSIFLKGNDEIIIKGFYQRELPCHLIAFSSLAGRKLFSKSLMEGNAHSFFPLIEQFHTQVEPSYCGLGTLVNVMNALKIDPKRVWKYPWRWFSEEFFDCCVPLEVVKKEGITLRQFACLAKCNGADCDIYRPQDTSLEEFRKFIIHSVESNDLTRIENDPSFIVVSYDRSTLGQTGTGHFSPLAAYNAENDMVLILDVARFKYPPHWVKIDLLWKSLYPIDSSTGLSRGFVVVKREAVKKPENAICYRVVVKEKWSETLSKLTILTKNITDLYTTKMNDLKNESSNQKVLFESIVQVLNPIIFDLIEPLLLNEDIKTEEFEAIKNLWDMKISIIYNNLKEYQLFREIMEYEKDKNKSIMIAILLISMPDQLFEDLNLRGIIGKLKQQFGDMCISQCCRTALESNISQIAKQIQALIEMSTLN